MASNRADRADKDGPTNRPGEVPHQANRDDFDKSATLSDSDQSALAELRDEGKRLLDGLTSGADTDQYRKLHWQGTFRQYIQKTVEHPLILRNAWQRLYDAIVSYGTGRNADGSTYYKVFNDPFNGGKDAIFGLDRQLGELVNIFRAGAEGLGPQNRLILLHGPVGTAKSTIARVLKNAVQHYSRLDDGEMYTFGFKVTADHPEYDPSEPNKVRWCPNNEEPLRLVAQQDRAALIRNIIGDRSISHELAVKGECCPACRQEFRELMARSNGDFNAVLNNVVVKRLILSESDRIGIGTFQPKDEKNQDSTELSGDINYRKIAVYGSDSDPRAFNFDGEFNIANRGILEFVEVLKLDTAFLYDLLGATQEQMIKPKKFAQTHIDEVILGHTNEPEYKRLVNDDKMEAFRDRTIKIDIPYILCLDREERIYENKFARYADRLAPHTITVAAMWAVMTRLEEPNDQRMTTLQKLKIYNGELIPGVGDPNAAAERARELQHSAPREGMSGISPRYITDTIATVLSSSGPDGITPFKLIRGLETKLGNNAMVKDEKVLARYRKLLEDVKRDYEDTIKEEVREAVVYAEPETIEALAANYLASVRRHVDRLEGRSTEDDPLPDPRLMGIIESKMGIIPAQADDIRRTLVNTLRSREEENKPFDMLENKLLRAALEEKLFEDCKDTIKLASSHSANDHTCEAIIGYLTEHFGYNRSSAQEILAHVADIYARGDGRKRG
jgi:serine protein kinase